MADRREEKSSPRPQDQVLVGAWEMKKLLFGRKKVLVPMIQRF